MPAAPSRCSRTTVVVDVGGDPKSGAVGANHENDA